VHVKASVLDEKSGRLPPRKGDAESDA